MGTYLTNGRARSGSRAAKPLESDANRGASWRQAQLAQDASAASLSRSDCASIVLHSIGGHAVVNILPLAKPYPVRALAPGETLIEAGEAGGELYVLQSGRLSVVREGIEIAGISEPGALIGEMSVLLGVDHSASVRAVGAAEVRVIENGIGFLEATPIVALHVATLACQRLDATSALVVQLRKQGSSPEPGFLERLFGALTGTEVEARR
jgi:CRP/FNR family transcriptional regulator, cyclic AMP receptor protein